MEDRVLADTARLREHTELLRQEKRILNKIADLLLRIQEETSPALYDTIWQLRQQTDDLIRYYSKMMGALLESSDLLEHTADKVTTMLESARDTARRIGDLV